MTNTSTPLSQQNTWCVLVAAGSGSRLSAHTKGCPKQFLTYQGLPLYMHAARTFARYAALKGIIFVFPQHSLEEETARLTELEKSTSLQVQWKSVAGGARRQDSVLCGLTALPPECTHVLVHDAARPFVSATLIQRVCEALQQGSLGVIPALPVVDTVKEIHEGLVRHTPDRNTLFSVQTPQGFELTTLLQAHTHAAQENFTVTDDASMLEQCGFPVRMVEGEAQNCKITHESDLMKLQENTASFPCSGFGYDVHRFVQKKDADKYAGKERPLKLGGVLMNGNCQVVAHSDGDVLLHALMDALLGAVALGDIGLHFPDSSESFDNADSAVLLQEVLRLVAEKGLQIHHVDLTIITQKPKIQPQRSAIQKNIAHLLSLPAHVVNVKATTEEGLGFTGEGAGIKSVALVTGTRTTVF